MNYLQSKKNYQVTFVWNALVIILDTVDVGYNVPDITICHNLTLKTILTSYRWKLEMQLIPAQAIRMKQSWGHVLDYGHLAAILNSRWRLCPNKENLKNGYAKNWHLTIFEGGEFKNETYKIYK